MLYSSSRWARGKNRGFVGCVLVRSDENDWKPSKADVLENEKYILSSVRP
jgi:hypothetical protein